MKGLIVIGYPGIGKSTYARYSDRAVDLESSYFGQDNMENYCCLAMDIADQGKIVFVSSHEAVCSYFDAAPFLDNVGKAIIICPRRTHKDEWTRRLEDRYDKTNLEKDRKALDFVKEHFESSIVGLNSNYKNLPVFQLNAMDYSLGTYIHFAEQSFCM